MNVDDAAIRKLILGVRPDIPPSSLEVCEMNQGDLVGFWYRPKDQPVMQGRTIALHKTDPEIAEALLTELMQEETRRKFAVASPGVDLKVQVTELSPYEGKGGRHPNTCTCSKHLKA